MTVETIDPNYKPAPEKPVPEKPAPEYPAPEYPVPEKPAPEYPVPEKPAPEKPAPEKPAPEYPAPEKPAPEKPAPEYPVPEKPAPEKPAPEYPVPEYPVPEKPAPEKPAPEYPVPEYPVPEKPVPEKPEYNPDYKPEKPGGKHDGNGDGGPQGGASSGSNGHHHHHHHHHHHADGGTPPAGMPDGHDDCPITAGLIATLELQSLPDFNVEEDFIVLNKEIFIALESEEGDGFSVEEEFVVKDEGPSDATGAVFVYNVLDMTLYYDANGAEVGFGEDGGAIFEFAEIVGNAEGLGVRDFFLVGAGGPGVHSDRLINEGIVATLDLQTLPEFNVEEDFVVISKEIFAALESKEGDGFSVEEEFVVAEEGSADTTGAVFVFAADGVGGGSLFYDANGIDLGYGDGGEVLDIAQITGNADGLGPDDFFVMV